MISDCDNQLCKECKRGDMEKIIQAIEKGANVNAGDKDICFSNHQMTPLQHASMEGHLEVVKYLIEKGANVNAKDRI